MQFSFPDQQEFDTVYHEVFKEHSYYVDLDTPAPLIIDAGAHIGVSALYFAKQYSRGKIICIEPNPKALDYLHKNIEQNDLSDRVSVIPKALVGETGAKTTTLYTHPQWGVFASLKPGGWTGEHAHDPIQVETVRLSDIIADQSVDLLKMDIEGMETEVLTEVREKFTQIKHLILEFHATKTHRLQKIQELLQTHFHEIVVSKDRRIERKNTDQLYLISAS